MKNKLGCHISFSKKNNYLPGAIQTGINYGCNTIMIFMGPPHTSKRVEKQLYNRDLYLNSSLSNKIKPNDIIAHGPYIINLANPLQNNFAISFLIDEMKRLDYIGGKTFVLHPGSNPNVKEGIESTSFVIKEALKKVPNINIAIETMAGKGNEIGVNFKQIKKIIDLVDNPRIGVCWDTCHLWDAGYNLNNLDLVIDDFDKMIGLSRLFVIHLNDSKHPLNSHKDRHANIGKGYLGLDLCKKINNSPKLIHINKILETPWVNGQPIYKYEIELLNNN